MIQYGYTAKADPQIAGPKYLRITDIQNDSVNWSEVPSCEIKQEDIAKYTLAPGDLVFARTGATVGKSFLIRATVHQSVFASYLIRIRFKAEVEPRYVAYFFQSPAYWRQVSESQAGIGQPNVNRKKLAQVQLPVPPLAEQRTIVAEIEKHLSRLDEAIANLKRAKANLKRYRAAVLQAAIGCRIPFTDLSAKVEQQSNWAWVTCGDVVESIEAGASFKCLERPPVDEEVGVVKVSAVTWGEFDERESKTCVDPNRVREALFIKPGDFLFSRANTIELVGACVIAKAVTKSLMLSDKILRFRMTARLDPRWLLICLRSKFGRAEIERLATGNQESMRNIGQDRIRQIRLPLPPLEEQHRIVAEVDRRLSIVREIETEADANLKRALALRQAVLANAFTPVGDSCEF